MAKESPWMDRLSLVFSLMIVLIASFGIWQQGALNLHMLAAGNAVWYLIRAAGTTAYIMLTISVVWGLAVTSQVVKGWSPGVVSMLLHGTLSWLAVVFSIGHMLLLLLDHYAPYTLAQILVPLTGPYRPVAVSLGALAFWGTLAIAASFRFKDRLGRRAWKALHLTSYGMFGLITAHALLAGTDATRIGYQALLAVSVAVVVALLGYRVKARA